MACAALLARALQPSVPGLEWERAKPEAAAYSSAKLDALRGWLKTQQTTAMMLVYRGRVIFEYGDLKLLGKIASVRKSPFGNCGLTMCILFSKLRNRLIRGA